jgi:hypothetical protein
MSGSDLNLARALLDGVVEQDSGGRLRTKYLREGSPKELQARRALARLLGSDGPLDRWIRTNLAALFDPVPPGWEQRKIRIVNRQRGIRDHVAATQIAWHVWEEVSSGKTVTDGIDSALRKFPSIKDESSVKKIWGRYRPVLEQIYGQLPRRRNTRS